MVFLGSSVFASALADSGVEADKRQPGLCGLFVDFLQHSDTVAVYLHGIVSLQ